MRTLITTLALLVMGACAGDSPSSAGRTCAGNLYDLCLQEHDCMALNMDCHNFVTEGFQVCSKSCTVGNDAPCGMTFDGRKATCSASGTCTPPGPNECTLP